MKTRIKEITAKGNALGYKNLKKKLKEYVTGWVNYLPKVWKHLPQDCMEQ